MSGQPAPHSRQVEPDHVADLEGGQAAPTQVEDVAFGAAEELREPPGCEKVLLSASSDGAGGVC